MTATNGFRLRHLLPPSRQASAFAGLSLAEQATQLGFAAAAAGE